MRGVNGVAYKNKADATAYQNKFIARSYDRIGVFLPKGQKEAIKAHAEKHDGGSVNAFIKRAIESQMERDNRGAGG